MARKVLLTGGMFFLVLIYLAGPVQFNVFHDLFHESEHEDLHSAANEREACHQAVYHHAKEGSCHHKTHLIANNKCSLCHLIVHAPQLLSDDVLAGGQAHTSLQQISLYQSYPFLFSPLLPSRAPPVC